METYVILRGLRSGEELAMAAARSTAAGEEMSDDVLLDPQLLNPSLHDGTIDAENPELLVYERRNDGTMKLVALEYLDLPVRWMGSGRPSLFGQEFDEIKANNRYGIPPSWALHAWIWKPNPSGMLYAWNPRVDCGPGAGS